MVRQEIVAKVQLCDIQKGCDEGGDACPVSRAVARQLHTSVSKGNIFTNRYEVEVSGANNNYVYRPATQRDARKLSKFVQNIDSVENQHLCRPTTIRLKLQENS